MSKRIKPSHVRMNSGELEQSRPTVLEPPRVAICKRRRSLTAVAIEYVLSSRYVKSEGRPSQCGVA